MELAAYAVMAAGAYVALITKERIVLYGWFGLYVLYSLVVRLMPPIVDMEVYARALAVWPPPLSIYTLREPIVWIGGPLLHRLLNDHVATFLVVDILTGLVVFRSMKLLDDGSGRMTFLAPTVISSFVFLLGQHNIWRQHIAFALLLWAIASRSRNQRRAIVLFVLAFLAHNAAAVFAGYWFDVGRGDRRRYGPLITLAGVISIALLFPWLQKSSVATALNTEYLYILVAGTLALLLIYANSGTLPGAWSPALLNFLAFTPGVFVLASAPFERIAMMFLVLILIDVYRHHAALRLGIAEAKHGVYGILVPPALAFSSSLRFLIM